MRNPFRGIHVLFSLSALLFTHDSRAASTPCYTPDGQDVNAALGFTIYQPCVNDTVSMCCATTNTGDDRCNQNGLVGICYNYVTDEYWRESCTDPTWQSPNCIKLFVNNTGFGGQPIGTNPDGTPVTDVQVTPCPDGSFCYGSGNSACCNAKQGLFINYATGETQPNKPNGKNGSNGLSKGAIAGIVIAAVVGIVLLLLVGCFFMRRRKARLSNAPEQDPWDQSVSAVKLGSYKQVYAPAEMESSTSRHELPSQHASELDGSRGLSEM